MVGGAARFFVRLLAALVVGIAVVAVGLVGLFWSGPVSVAFLTPYVETFVDEAHPDIRLSVGDTILTWAGWDRGIDVRAVDVRVSTKANVTIAEMPEVAVALSPGAMANGVLAPNRIDIFGPEVFIRRAMDGGLQLSFGPPGVSDSRPATPGADGGLDRIIAFLGETTNPDNPMSYLESVAIVGGAASLFDERTGLAWFAPVANAVLRRGETGLGFEGSLTADLSGTETDLDFVGALDAETGETQIAVRYSDLVPKALADLDPAAEPLRGVDAALSGTVAVTVAADQTVSVARAEIKAEAGRVVLPPPADTELAFQSAFAIVAYDRVADTVRVETLDIDFGDGGRLAVPAIEHVFPIRRFSAAATISPLARVVTVERLEADLAGPTVTATARIDGVGTPGVRIAAQAAGSDIPVSELSTYWPKSLGSDANEWSVEHLRDGIMNSVSVDAELAGTPDGGLTANRLDGRMRITGTTIDYLEGMPPVTGVTGNMTIDATRFDVAVETGMSNGLTVSGGTISLYDLHTDIEKADIRLDITGPARNAVGLIDNPTLSFASAVGLSAERVRGASEIDFQILFPLKKDLSWDEVQVKAKASVADLEVRAAALGQNLTGATANLAVDNDGLSFNGVGTLGRLPIRVSWRENFSEPRAFKSRYDVQTRVSDVTTLADLGIDLGPVSADTISGTVAADIVFTERAVGDARLTVDANLIDASVQVPAFGWEKPQGVAGRAEIALELTNDLISMIPAFSVTAPGLDVRGLVNFADDGTGLESVRLQQFRFGRTDVVGILLPRDDGGWDVDFNGPSLDLTALWGDLTDETAAGPADEADDPLLPDMTVSMRVDTVWLEDDRRLQGLSGAFSRENNAWRSIFVESTGEEDTRFTLGLAPGDDGNRVLTMRAQNAGAVLRALGLYDNMIGGRLDLVGTFDDSDPDEPLSGTLSVTDYRIVNLPWLARLVSVMALTGIADSLQGSGISFSSLEMPFERTAETMVIRDGKAFGASLGITVTGTFYLGAGALDLNGTIVPAYAINSMLGNVPLLGPLFTGGEEGGGVFAANYSVGGTREDPDVTINPLSALAPGFLRNIFGVLDGTTQIQGRSGPADPDAEGDPFGKPEK